MATVTAGVGVASTTDGANYAQSSIVPSVGDLMVVLSSASGTQTNAATCTDSTGELTFTMVDFFFYAGSTGIIHGFVSNQKATSTTTRTLTVGYVGDPATGCVFNWFFVGGMGLTGTAAVRQHNGQDNAAIGTPAPVFGVAALTTNPCFGIVGNSTNPATLTPPASWTEACDLGYATPTSGAETVFRASGFTGTTVTWGSSSATAFGSMVMELDATVTAGIPDVVMAPPHG